MFLSHTHTHTLMLTCSLGHLVYTDHSRLALSSAILWRIDESVRVNMLRESVHVRTYTPCSGFSVCWSALTVHALAPQYASAPEDRFLLEQHRPATGQPWCFKHVFSLFFFLTLTILCIEMGRQREYVVTPAFVFLLLLVKALEFCPGIFQVGVRHHESVAKNFQFCFHIEKETQHRDGRTHLAPALYKTSRCRFSIL